MTAGTWGDRAFPPGHIPDRVVREWLTRPPVVVRPYDWYMAEAREAARAQRAETEARERRMTTPNGVEVNGPPGLMAALAEVKPLPWKWIGFGALVAVMAYWVLSA